MDILSTHEILALKKVDQLSVEPDGYLPAPVSYSFTRGDGLDLPTDEAEVAKFNLALIQGSEIIYDTPQSARLAYDVSSEYLKKIVSASDDEGVNVGEDDVAGKFSIQRRLPPRYFIRDPELKKVSISDDFDFCLQHYVKKVASVSKIVTANPFSIMLTDSDPFDTNQGYPTYSTDPLLRFDTGRALSIKSYKVHDILESIKFMNASIGMPDWLLWPAAVAKRTGATRKPIRVFKDHSDGISCYSDTEATGYYTRARKVYMMPFYFNVLISPLALAMKHGRINIKGFGHDAAGERSYLSIFNDDPQFDVAESDLSGYDTSIAPELRMRLWYWCRKFGFNQVALDLLELFEKETVILTAPYNRRQRGSMAYIAGRTGLLSGLKVTTEVGSALSAAATLKALLRCKVITRSQIESGEWPLFLMLGDDILLRTPKGAIDPGIFEASYAEEGLKVKYLYPGKRFLMNHIKDQQKWGVASRFIQQSLFNEDKYSHEGQLRLGIAARLTKSYFPYHWKLLANWAGDISSIVKIAEPYQIMAKSADASSAALEILKHPSIDLFLKSAAGQHWLQDLSSKASITGFGRELLDMLPANFLESPSQETERRALLASMFNTNVKDRNSSVQRLNKAVNG